MIQVPYNPGAGHHTGPSLPFNIPGVGPYSGPASPVPPPPDPIDTRARVRGSRYDSFEPISLWPEDGGFTLKCQPGHVEEVIPQFGIDCVVLHDVTYDGAPHTVDTEISVPIGHTLVVHVSQDATGRVKDTDGALLEVVASRPDSSHWYPDDPEGPGLDGGMYFPLYKIDVVDGVTEITLYHWGPVVVRNDLWIGKNIGTGSRVFKEHAEAEGAVYKFRNVLGGYGINDTEGADITFDFDGDNIGDGAQVYVEPGNVDVVNASQAEFRTLSPRDSYDPQIHVVEDGRVIRIQGNDKNLNPAGVVKNLVTVDGLVTAFDTVALSGGDLNLSVYILVYDLVGVRNSAGTGELGNIIHQVDTNSPVVYYWRGGLYIGNSDEIGDPGGAPDLADVTFMEYVGS